MSTSTRGFASLSKERRQEISSKGGRAAHAKGTAHEWTPETAVAAGRKGGLVVSRDRARMAQLGRKGGKAKRGTTHRKPGEAGPNRLRTADGFEPVNLP